MTPVERVRVGDVLRLERREVVVDPETDYRLIGVYSFGKGIFHREPQLGLDLGDYRFFHIEPDDLVLSNIQAWEGAIAHARARDSGTIGTHRFLTYVPRDAEQIDTNWARWFFLSEPGMLCIRQAAPGTAVRNRTLAIKRFEDLGIPLPPIDEQRRVADRLDGIRFVADQVAILARHAEAVRAAFVPSAAGAPHEPQADKLARGWCWTELRSVMVRSAQQVTVNPDGSYPNLGIYGFGRGVFSKPPIEGDRTSAKTLYRVRAGQFIYSRLFAFEGAYATVPDEFDGNFVSNEFPSFDADGERLDPEWLASYLRSPERWAELAASSIGLGVRRQRVPVDALLDYRVLLPPIDEQRQAVESISRISQAAAKSARARGHAAAIVPASLNHEFASLRG